MSREDKKKNGFSRKFIDSNIILDKYYEFSDYNFGFLSDPDNNIWISDLTKSFVAKKIDYSLQNIRDLHINVPKDFPIGNRPLEMHRMGSTIFSINKTGDLAVIFKNSSLIYKLPPVSIHAIIPISKNTIIGSVFTNANGKYSTKLIKIKLSKNSRIINEFSIPKQVDGLFCSDGSMEYDIKHSKIFYMFYNRGQFLCLDTNLKILYKANTIDTNRLAKIKIITRPFRYSSGKISNKTFLEASNQIVNRYLVTDSANVYVNSNLVADNEKKEDLWKSDPIDVYSIYNGRYLYSFYVPKYRGYKIRQFKFNRNKIVACYRNYLVALIIKRKT
ncbi:hypothetical protein [Pedobacter westerhofensis]|nr:hypothetical protein [Pedobacter westerhofensis]